MSTTKKASGRFKAGDWVSFRYGTKDLTAQVVEARGPLGVNGRHLYRVRSARDGDEADYFEMPEDELEFASPPDQEAIIQYLKDGGLVAILRSNLGGGKKRPKVWLTYTPRAGVTHTFDADRGVVGGATVPFFALHEGKVFTGKEDEVSRFLETFGLSRKRIDEVLAAVGTAP